MPILLPRFFIKHLTFLFFLGSFAPSFAQNRTADSLQTYNKALQIDEKPGRKAEIPNNLDNLAIRYKKKGDYSLALDYFQKSTKIKEELGDQLGMAANFDNIGAMYSDLEKRGEALVYYKMALPIYEKAGDQKGIARTLSNMGIILMGAKDQKARAYFSKSLQISERINDQAAACNAIMNIGTLESNSKNYDQALRYFNKAVQINKNLGRRKELSYCYLKTGKVYFAKNDYQKAEAFASLSLQLSKAPSLPDIQKDGNLLLADSYYATKQYKLAYEKRMIHKSLYDSIFKTEGLDKLSEIKYKYEFKDKLNSAANRESSLKKAVKTKDGELETSQHQKIWWIIGFLGLFALLGFLAALVKIRKVKMENKQLLTEQKLRRSQMNPHFIFNSIQNVRSLINSKKEKEAVDYLNKFSKLTRQILESSDENYTSLAEEAALIKNYIAIQQLLYSHKFDFSIAIEGTIDAEATFLPPMLTQPFIENAIKHGLASKQENGKLEICFYLKEGKLFFEVSDNGGGFDVAKKQENHKSMAMSITRKRLAHYSKNQEFSVHADNIVDRHKKIVGAKISFEIPYIYEN